MDRPLDVPRLPHELQVLVIERADRPTLKQCRLASRALNRFATSELFCELHLADNIQNFRHALNITRDPSLAACVKKIMYHNGVLSDAYRAVDSFRRRVTWLREGHDVPLLTSREIEQMHINYARVLTEQAEYKQQINVGGLSDLVRRLPNVDAVDCKDPDPATYDPKGFNESLTGLPVEPDAAGISFLAASLFMWDRRLTAISNLHLDIQVFAILFTNFSACLENLGEVSQLRFHFQISTILGRPLGNSLQYFTQYLTLTQSLRQLTLSFDVSTDGFDQMQLVWEPVLRCHWPSLWRLDVGGIVACERDLVKFLSDHTPTLRQLRLENLRMQDNTPTPRKSNWGCISPILFLFNQMQSLCQLKRVCLAGIFVTRSGQGWRASKTANEGGVPCYRAQLEDYICHRGPLPAQVIGRYAVVDVGDMSRISHQKLLDSTATPDLDSGQTEGAISSQQLDDLHPCVFSDASWTWCAS